jgi:hypothetical protein
MSVLIKGLEMPETEYMDVRIFRDGTATIATGTKPYYRELKAEPVRHGKWMFTPSDAFEAMFTKPKCSECGFESADGGNYCPACGARMDEG